MAIILEEMSLQRTFSITLLITMLFLFGYAYCLDLEKVEVYFDKDYLTIKIWGQGYLPENFEEMIKNNIDVKVLVSVRLFRRDLKPLNVVTEVTNYKIMRQISYDLVTENFLVFDGERFKLSSSLSEVPKNIFPLVIRQRISELKELPDLSVIYNNTDFVVVAKMRVFSLDWRPPLSIIASILNLGVWESKEVYSEPFLIR